MNLRKEQIKNQKKIVQDSKPDKGRVKEMEKNCEGLQQIFTDASEKGRDIKDKVKSKDQCLDGRNISFPNSLMIVSPMQLFVVS